jgi:Domain of unknown function (DUF1772)
MTITALRLIALLFTALSLGAALAHALELVNKMKLSRQEYLIAQKLYRGWEWLGVVEAVALFSTLGLAITVRHEPAAFWPAAVSVLCIAATLGVFLVATSPANRETKKWSEAPDNWMEVRKRWEYSHAIRASLFGVALIALILSVL